jgi:hypothetical protein
MSLAKMGCVMKDGPGQKIRESGKTTHKRLLCRKGSMAAESTAERMEITEYTLWNLEREVERSRLSSTFEQIKLHEIFADALCDEMQHIYICHFAYTISKVCGIKNCVIFHKHI